MATEIVEQLTNGVVVRLSDGALVHCKPLSLADAIVFFDLWDIRGDAAKNADERYEARIKMVRRFNAAYPDLAGRITAADVDRVLPGFFWIESGAVWQAPPSITPPTGTPPSAPTPPDTAGAPT